jgi:hypothetical protein
MSLIRRDGIHRQGARSPALRRDLGCGPGRRSVDHSEGADCRLPSVDLGQAFLQHLHRRVGAAGEGSSAADIGAALGIWLMGSSSFQQPRTGMSIGLCSDEQGAGDNPRKGGGRCGLDRIASRASPAGHCRSQTSAGHPLGPCDRASCSHGARWKERAVMVRALRLCYSTRGVGPLSTLSVNSSLTSNDDLIPTSLKFAPSHASAV